MKRLAALLIALLPGPAASAAPMTLPDLRDALLAQGAEAFQMEQRDGGPVLSGEILGQPFTAKPGDCSGPEPVCHFVSLEACRDMPDYSRIEALEFVNAYNMRERKAVALATEDWFGQLICLRLRQALPSGAETTPAPLAGWPIELEDFLQSIDAALTDKLAANALDSATQ